MIEALMIVAFTAFLIVALLKDDGKGGDGGGGGWWGDGGDGGDGGD